MSELEFYREQSVYSSPGAFAGVWDAIEPTIPAMAGAIHPLLFHYRGDGDFAENGIAAERVCEINLRYADAILARASELAPIVPGEERTPGTRVVGCCRDWALLLVSLARHHGFAARSRVGFADYFVEGWWIDHTIAEIWDEREQRWRLIDPELRVDFVPRSGDGFARTAIPRARFLPGLEAWRRTRAGELDASQFVVAPEIEVPQLRGIPYLWHNVVEDLAALNRREMLLWDLWGIDLEGITDQGLALLDAVASAQSFEERQEFFTRDAFRVPETVLSVDPVHPGPPSPVTLRQG